MYTERCAEKLILLHHMLGAGEIMPFPRFLMQIAAPSAIDFAHSVRHHEQRSGSVMLRLTAYSVDK